MKPSQQKPALQSSEPDQLITAYLQTLLSEVEEHSPRTTTAPQLETSAPATDQAPPETETTPQPVIPHWAKERFQCLLFEINGLHLAVPLSELESIAGRQPSKTTHLWGQPEWHRGILQHRGRKVGVIDMARLVMPGKLPPPEEQTVSPNHVLIIGNGDWGLMCDKLLSPIMVEPDAVRWSCRHKNRAWMAGTLPEQLCIILDLEVILAMISPARTGSKTGMNSA